jgi:hypothetical protein
VGPALQATSSTRKVRLACKNANQIPSTTSGKSGVSHATMAVGTT